MILQLDSSTVALSLTEVCALLATATIIAYHSLPPRHFERVGTILAVSAALFSGSAILAIIYLMVVLPIPVLLIVTFGLMAVAIIGLGIALWDLSDRPPHPVGPDPDAGAETNEASEDDGTFDTSGDWR
jgi:hypothetical protein